MAGEAEPGPTASDAEPGAARRGPIEVELKYAVRDAEALAPLLATESVAGLPAGPARTIVVEDRYFDTATRAIERSGFVARLRDRPSGTQVAVKSLVREDAARSGETVGAERPGGIAAAAGPAAESPAALHRRLEVEGPATNDLDPGAWPESDARTLVEELTAGAPLVERFRIRQRRQERELRGDPGLVTLSFDDVEVNRDGQTLGTYVALEAEIHDGDEALLGTIASALEATGLVVPEPLSKFELAARMVDAEAAGSVADLAAKGLDAAELVAGGEAVDEFAGGSPAAPDHPVAEPGTPPGHVVEREERLMETAAAGLVEALSGGSSDEGLADEDSYALEDVRPEPTVEISAWGPAPEALGPAERYGLVVGRSPGVVGEDLLAEAGRKVLRFHLVRMLNKEAGTRGGDADDLHDMRVATRRMRAAWRVFGDAYRPAKERRYVAELRTLGGHLGAVRDLDVLIDALDGYEAALPGGEAAALKPLGAEWRRQRQRARDTLTKFLDSEAYQRFVEDYVEFARTEGAASVSGPATAPHRVRDTAGSRTWSAYEHVRAYDGVLRWADIPTIHQLRIAGKRLRYTLEFFREPLGPETGPLIERVTALQDHLGLLHDADVAAGLARGFLVERSARLAPDSTEAIGRYLAGREQEVARLRRTLGPVWRRMVAPEFRRALGRSVSSL